LGRRPPQAAGAGNRIVIGRVLSLDKARAVMTRRDSSLTVKVRPTHMALPGPAARKLWIPQAPGNFNGLS
jgi:hypothetical protein